MPALGKHHKDGEHAEPPPQPSMRMVVTVTIDFDWRQYMTRHGLSLPAAVAQRMRSELVSQLRHIPETHTIYTHVEQVE